jgi:hypothetical protein
MHFTAAHAGRTQVVVVALALPVVRMAVPYGAVEAHHP